MALSPSANHQITIHKEFVLYKHFSSIKKLYFARFFDAVFCGVFV